MPARHRISKRVAKPLIFHPHLHILAADGLFTPDGRFHCMPAEDLAPAIEKRRRPVGVLDRNPHSG